FALIEQSGSGLGNAFSGGAASAEDASTIFYNPAGMSRLSGKQITVAGSMIKPTAKFSGTGLPGTDMGGDAGSWALVPNAYFAMEVNPALRVGFGINAPFGLQSEYTPSWVGRANAIKSKLETINFNPSASYQVNERLSLGGGINYQRIRGQLTSFAGASGTSSMTGNDSAWGYNFGALYNVSPQTRVGVSYRSAISYNLNGSMTFSNVPALITPVTLAIKVPDSFSLSVFHQLDSKWDVMADASWTGWSAFQQLKVIVVATGLPAQTVQENWRDTWRISAGSNYHYNEQWTARMGVAYDQTPVSDAFRTARIPDGSRTWLSLGGQYKPGKESAIDFGYAHLFVNSASINATNIVPNPGPLVGTYNVSMDILSAQYAHGF
ncbi:MAG: outer membrane protein transport protein, partial [Gallionella sp.]|nr:outer membrane protein transport protein [Gallionella sp.]